jgi:hypothetical protein
MELTPRHVVPAVSRPAVRVHIGELRLIGFHRSDHTSLAETFQAELGRRIGGGSLSAADADRLIIRNVTSKSARGLASSAAAELARRLGR